MTLFLPSSGWFTLMAAKLVITCAPIYNYACSGINEPNVLKFINISFHITNKMLYLQIVFDNNVTSEQARSVVMTSTTCSHYFSIQCSKTDTDGLSWTSYYGARRWFPDLGGSFCPKNGEAGIQISPNLHTRGIKNKHDTVGNPCYLTRVFQPGFWLSGSTTDVQSEPTSEKGY